MQFTKAQRIELEGLSFALFGAEKHYTRFSKTKVLEDFITVREEKMITVNRGGTKMTLRKAIAKGLVTGKDKNGDDVPLFVENQKPAYREPTFEEVRRSMVSALEMKRYSELSPVHVMLDAAANFVKGTLENLPYLVVSDNEKNDFKSLVDLIPEDKRKVLNERVVPKQNKNVFCLNGFQFASDVLFCVTRPEESAELLVKYENADYADGPNTDDDSESLTTKPDEGSGETTSEAAT